MKIGRELEVISLYSFNGIPNTAMILKSVRGDKRMMNTRVKYKISPLMENFKDLPTAEMSERKKDRVTSF